MLARIDRYKILKTYILSIIFYYVSLKSQKFFRISHLWVNYFEKKKVHNYIMTVYVNYNIWSS